MRTFNRLVSGIFISALALGCGGGQDSAGTTTPTTPTTGEAATPVTDTTTAVKDTKAVVDHHLVSFGKGDVDAILSDYTENSVLITPMGSVRGHAALRQLFTKMTTEFAKPGMKFKLEKQAVEGEVAFIVWSGETADNTYEFATDTFIVRDGKIAYQTFAAKVTPKGNADAPPATAASAPVKSPTLDVVMHHLKSFGERNMDNVLSDYTESSVFITPMGTIKGAAALKPVFAGMFAEFAKPGAKFNLVKLVTEDDIAFIVWSAETADNTYELATDTFVIKDGKIVSQTFAGKITPKAAAK